MSMFFHGSRGGLESSVLVRFRGITFCRQLFIDVRSMDACTCRRPSFVLWIRYVACFCDIKIRRMLLRHIDDYSFSLLSGLCWIRGFRSLAESVREEVAKPPGRLWQSKSKIAIHNPRLRNVQHDVLSVIPQFAHCDCPFEGLRTQTDVFFPTVGV